MNILGIRFGHDSSAVLMSDGRLVADVAEDWFCSRRHPTRIVSFRFHAQSSSYRVFRF